MNVHDRLDRDQAVEQDDTLPHGTVADLRAAIEQANHWENAHTDPEAFAREVAEWLALYDTAPRCPATMEEARP